MHAISVPDDVILRDPLSDEPIKGAEPVTFKAFVISTLMADERWRRDLEVIESGLKIKKAVRGFGKPGDRLLLEDEDFKRLKECAEKPTNGYGNWAAGFVDQFAPFLFAIKHGAKE